MERSDTKMLTAKQEGFSNDVASGMTLSDAYRHNYDAKNMTDKQIWEEASKLASNPKVNQRLKELREKASNNAIMTAIERKKWLTDILKSDEKLENRLKALDILNKMDGEYVTKIQGEVELTDIRVELTDD